MKLRNLMGFTLALALLFAATVDAGQKHQKQKYIKWDRIIGAYNLLAPGNPENLVYGSLVMNAGGTWTGMITADLGQPTSPEFPCGLHTTVGLGTWEKLSCNTYKLFLSNVTVTTMPPTNGEVESPCCCPTMPLWRQKGEAVITLSQDGNSFSTDNFILSFWNVNDLSMDSDNIVPPFSAGPFIGQRVGD